MTVPSVLFFTGGVSLSLIFIGAVFNDRGFGPYLIGTGSLFLIIQSLLLFGDPIQLSSGTIITSTAGGYTVTPSTTALSGTLNNLFALGGALAGLAGIYAAVESMGANKEAKKEHDGLDELPGLNN